MDYLEEFVDRIGLPPGLRARVWMDHAHDGSPDGAPVGMVLISPWAPGPPATPLDLADALGVTPGGAGPRIALGPAGRTLALTLTTASEHSTLLLSLPPAVRRHAAQGGAVAVAVSLDPVLADPSRVPDCLDVGLLGGRVLMGMAPVQPHSRPSPTRGRRHPHG